MQIRIVQGSNMPAGKLAEAELIFSSEDGPLSGLRLLGFGIWESRHRAINVTFPARTYEVNRERRTFALLRPDHGATDTFTAMQPIRDAIISAYNDHVLGEYTGPTAPAAQLAPPTAVVDSPPATVTARPSWGPARPLSTRHVSTAPAPLPESDQPFEF